MIWLHMVTQHVVFLFMSIQNSMKGIPLQEAKWVSSKSLRSGLQRPGETIHFWDFYNLDI